MKKTLMCALLTTALIACKKEDTATEKKESTQFIRVQAVDFDNHITNSKSEFVEVYESQ
jgi:hypothetical protein